MYHSFVFSLVGFFFFPPHFFVRRGEQENDGREYPWLCGGAPVGDGNRPCESCRKTRRRHVQRGRYAVGQIIDYTHRLTFGVTYCFRYTPPTSSASFCFSTKGGVPRHGLVVFGSLLGAPEYPASSKGMKIPQTPVARPSRHAQSSTSLQAHSLPRHSEDRAFSGGWRAGGEQRERKSGIRSDPKSGGA